MIVLLCIFALILTNGLFFFAMYVLYAENRQLHMALLKVESPVAAKYVEPRTVKEESELRDRVAITEDIFDGTL